MSGNSYVLYIVCGRGNWRELYVPRGGGGGQWASISLIEDNFSHTYPDTHIESQDKFATKSRSKQLNCT